MTVKVIDDKKVVKTSTDVLKTVGLMKPRKLSWSSQLVKSNDKSEKPGRLANPNGRFVFRYIFSFSYLFNSSNLILGEFNLNIKTSINHHHHQGKLYYIYEDWATSGKYC